MTKNTITKYREKSGLTQSALAEKLNVTRQTVSSWETGRTEPDIDSMTRMAEIFGIDMNALTGFSAAHTEIKRPIFEIFLGLAVVPAIAACFSGAGFDNIFTIWVLLFCSLVTVIPLACIAKSGDFTMLSGYDKNAEYNTTELRRMLYTICMHISCDTLAWEVILAFCAFGKMGKVVVVTVALAYVMDFLLSILIISKKYESRVYINKPNKPADKAFAGVSVPYIIMITAQCIILTLKCAIDERHGLAVAMCFAALIAETAWLLYEFAQNRNNSEYVPRNVLRYTVIAFGIVCTVLMLL